jgi:3-deoxy-manno-octulosonate cytidylyltransferase (CMP-KDO synthetase)
MKMNPVILIPSRLASTRLPNKPLSLIHNIPMIVHVWQKAVASGIGPVYVAAAEKEIIEVIENAGGKALLTDPNLPSGTDRIASILDQLDPYNKHDIILNIQGDLPLLDPVSISKLADIFASCSDADMATLVAPIDPFAHEERESPHVVKAVVSWFDNQIDKSKTIGRALYFSRHLVPYGEGPFYHHVGLYAYRLDALKKFVSLPPSPLEVREKLEQLRALEAGMNIMVGLIDHAPHGVDTPEDLKRVRYIVGDSYE